MKHTRVYRRDIPRTHTSQLKDHDEEAWDYNLSWLEKQRFSIAKQARSKLGAGGFYNVAREALREVGENVDDLYTDADVWQQRTPADKRVQDMQRLTTRLAHVFNPEEKKEEGKGDGSGGEGKGSSAGPQPTAGQQPQPQEEEEEETEEEGPPAYSGGGKQHYGETKEDSIFYAVRYLISKLAEHDDYSETVPFGHSRWDAKRVLSAYWDPLMLDDAKRDYARQVDDIYLILDTSGSVSRLADNIAAIAAGAAGIVHLYSGTEGRPEYKVPRNTPLRTPRDPFPEWENQTSLTDSDNYSDYKPWQNRFVEEQARLYPEWSWEERSFETDLAWFLRTQKPPRHSRILFWGDTQGVLFGCPRLLAALLRPYRAAWLLSEPFMAHWNDEYADEYPPQKLLNQPGILTSPEWPKWQAAGLPIIENVQTAEHVRNMLQALQMLT